MHVIHWKHPAKGYAACGTVTYFSTSHDRFDQSITCRRCIVIHQAWLDQEIAKFRSIQTTGHQEIP